MYAIEFKTKIKDGIIKVPNEYIDKLKENVKVIVLKDDKEVGEKVGMIDHLFISPLKVDNFRPLSRGEIYEHH